MVVNCEQVWREISNYLDHQVEPELRAAMEEHVRGCKRCTAVLDGTRNVIQLYADERMVEVPLGFGRRLHRRLEDDMVGSRRTFIGWLVTAAAAVLVFAGFEAGRSSAFRTALRSQLAQTARGIPPDLKVVVAEDGRTFHVPGCPFIHDKTHLRTMLASEAEHDGYVPCVRCMRKYLHASASDEHPEENQAG